MFNVGITGMGSNGFMNMIMQSDADTQAAIEEFDKRISELDYSIPPAVVFEQVLEDMRIKKSDLMYADRKRIERKVEEVSAGGFRYE